MTYKTIELEADKWTGLTDEEDNTVPLKCQNLTWDSIRVMEADSLEEAERLNTGFVIGKEQFFETTSLKPVFFKARTSGTLIYHVDVRA